VTLEGRSEPTRPEIEEQLERIKRSNSFSRRGTSLKLLEFLVRRSLDDKPSNEREVGIELHNRDVNWVTADDNIVRMGRWNLQKYLAE